MSQEKAQLIAPLGNMTVPGVTATGVITATSFEGNIAGSASSIKQGSSISAGVVTASSFAGNLTGNIQRLADSGPNISVGVVTATSFSGNLTGSVTDLTSAPAITVGVVTATTLKGPVTGNITGNVSGTAGGLGVNYNGGWPGAGTSQISAGVMTATSYHGDGSNLDGVSSGPVSQQAVTIDGASTSIDLSNGNLIYATQSANTTVSFANSENGTVYFIRTQADGYLGTQTITWPTGIGWSGGTAPTLLSNPTSGDAQIFKLVTRDEGETWYGKEVFSINEESYSIWSFGWSNYGNLGQNNQNVKISSPTQIGSGTDWKTLNDGQSSGVSISWSSAIKTDGTLWMWGGGWTGQLGQNDIVNRSSPTQIPGTWSYITNGGGGNSVAAINTDGELYTWGYNFYGQLGQNVGVAWPGPNSNLGTLSSPTQVGSDTTWKSVHAGNEGYLSLKTDGTAWGWGTNQYGNIGINDNTKRSSPTQLPGTTWSDFDMGQWNVAALKTDGSLWTWGTGQDGGGGQNNTTTYSSPMQVGTDTTWKAISAGYYGVLATKTDGTLWTWGSNSYGKLALNQAGPGSSNSRSSPTQVGTGTDWAKGTSNRYGGFALKNDGSVWSWGRGVYGIQGTNDQITRSSPVQIPGSWSSVSQTYWGAIMTKPT